MLLFAQLLNKAGVLQPRWAHATHRTHRSRHQRCLLHVVICHKLVAMPVTPVVLSRTCTERLNADNCHPGFEFKRFKDYRSIPMSPAAPNYDELKPMMSCGVARTLPELGSKVYYTPPQLSWQSHVHQGQSPAAALAGQMHSPWHLRCL